MTRSNARAELDEWFVALDRLLAEEREHAISPLGRCATRQLDELV